LIPDKEDPDSYVNKVGAAAFTNFIAENKKDFILFQLEIALQDAGNDSNKKAAVVNQVAETISKINKAEDFTKQQDYIKRCSELLKIEESGLHALVNKLIREKINKEENKFSRQRTDEEPPLPDEFSTGATEALSLFNKDELHERAMIRSLLEFGMMEWEPGITVAAHMLKEIEDNNLEELIDNKELVRIIQTYFTWYKEGMEPTAKSFLYHDDLPMSALVVALMDFNYEISSKWKDNYEVIVLSRADLFKEEVHSTLNYLKLRKIKRLISQNQHDLESATKADDQMIFVQIHQHLKKMEIELTKQLGIVIFR